jgi:drug/metabolite transporter (DMT)-like permease
VALWYNPSVISEPTYGALCALGSAVAWALTSLLARSVISQYGSVTINALRSGIAGALLVALVSATDGPEALITMSGVSFALLAISIVAAVAVGDTIFFESTRAIGLGPAMTIATTYPVGAALLAAAWLAEPITVPIAAGALLTLVGVALIVLGRSAEGRPERLWFGVGAALIASAAWALSTVMLKPPLREIEPLTAQAIRLPLASALLWLTPWTRGAGAALRDAGQGPLLRMLALSVVTAFSSVLFVAGIKHAGVAIGSVLASTAPLFALPLGVFFLGERVSVVTIAGVLLAVAGIVVLQL